MLLLFQAALKAILLKMNLDSERSDGAERHAKRRLLAACDRRPSGCPFKKKRKLFLIFQLSISKYKFHVTISDIYACRSAACSWQRNINLFPFQQLKAPFLA